MAHKVVKHQFRCSASTRHMPTQEISHDSFRKPQDAAVPMSEGSALEAQGVSLAVDSCSWAARVLTWRTPSTLNVAAGGG